MSRDHFISQQPTHINFMHSNSPSRFPQHSQFADLKKSHESDLMIFNGQQPERDLYQMYDNSPKSSNTHFPPLPKNPSQKPLPIIYNTYNEGSQPRIQPTRPPFIARDVPINQKQAPFEQFNQNSRSNFSQSQQTTTQYHSNGQAERQQFHTFQNIPVENELQTAHFLNFPDHRSPQQEDMSASELEQYRPPEQYYESRQKQHTFPTFSNQPANGMTMNRAVSRYLQVPVPQPPAPNIPISSRSRVQLEEQPQRIVNIQMPSSMQPQLPMQTQMSHQPQLHTLLNSQMQYQPQEDRIKLIQIPQEEYDKFVEHLPACKRMQEESHILRDRLEQLTQRDHYSSQEAKNLREQNQRLRDLVVHLEKREKDFQKEKEEIKWFFQEQVSRYRESTLQQFSLLMERYRLQLHKKK